jgi:hypothetical protein
MRAAKADPTRSRLREFDAPVFSHLGSPSERAAPLVMASPARTSLSLPVECGAGNATLSPAAGAHLGRVRLPCRRLDAHHGRRSQAQGKALRAAGRHPVADVSVLGHAQALRGRRPPGGRCAAHALGHLGCAVQGAERLRRRDRQLPQPLHRRAAALVHLPARPPLHRAVGQAGPRGGAAADRAVGHARPPDRRHVRAGTKPIRSASSSWRWPPRLPPSRSRRACAPHRRRVGAEGARRRPDAGGVRCRRDRCRRIRADRNGATCCATAW